MTWYWWLALALGLWSAVALVAGFAAARVIAYAASAGIEVLERPVAPAREADSAAAVLPVTAH
jgi:hypothetical protein